jgi:hypothetical protein
MAVFRFFQLNQLRNVLIGVRMSKNPDVYVRELERKILSNDRDSPRAIMRRFGDRTKDAVLRKYDATRSKKNADRRTGQLRAAITRQGPVVDNFGNVTVTIGAQLPLKAPYWRFAEFGTRPSLRTQGYQVVGPGSRSGLNKEGVSIPRRAIIGFAVAGDEISPLVGIKRFKQSNPSLKLIPRKASDLARIRRKIFLSFTHPGFQGGHFIREGLIFIVKNAQRVIDQGIARMLKNVEKSTNAKNAKA